MKAYKFLQGLINGMTGAMVGTFITLFLALQTSGDLADTHHLGPSAVVAVVATGLFFLVAYVPLLGEIREKGIPYIQIVMGTLLGYLPGYALAYRVTVAFPDPETHFLVHGILVTFLGIMFLVFLVVLEPQETTTEEPISEAE